MKKFNKTAIVS